MLDLHLITPMSRTEFLIDLLENVLTYTDKVHIEWYIVLDNSLKDKSNILKQLLTTFKLDSNLEIHILNSSKTDNSPNPGGHALRNDALEYLKSYDDEADSWVYSLDDDNLLHPGLINTLLTENLDEYDMIAGVQIMKNGTIRLDTGADKMKVCHVDTASCAFKWELIRDKKYEPNDYCADGLFVEAVYPTAKNCLFVYKPICYYNYLRN
jgi:hypothetical protein